MVMRVLKNGESSKNSHGRGRIGMILQISQGLNLHLQLSYGSIPRKASSRGPKPNYKPFPGRRGTPWDRIPHPLKPPLWRDTDSSDLSDSDYQHNEPPFDGWDNPYKYGQQPPGNPDKWGKVTRSQIIRLILRANLLSIILDLGMFRTGMRAGPQATAIMRTATKSASSQDGRTDI